MFSINDKVLTVERYPDNTLKIKLYTEEPEVIIKWLYEKDEEMLLHFILSHLRAGGFVKKLSLHMPYIPHARMDRVKNPEEVFTLKYFCEFINMLKFDRVIVRDPHSYVSLALLNNVECEPIDEEIKNLLSMHLDQANDIVFFPDEGSSKRYGDMIGYPYAFGIKKRDWKTGKILDLEVQGQIPPKGFKVFIIDDISSYGGTFLHSAKKLKALGADKIYLYITHCEDSILKGELITSGLIERIYTTKSIYSQEHPLIEVIGGR